MKRPANFLALCLSLGIFQTTGIKSKASESPTKAAFYNQTVSVFDHQKVSNVIKCFLNLGYSPIQSLNLGIEYNYANRSTVDFKYGHVKRVTLGALYKF